MKRVLLYSFFWVIPQRLNFTRRRFGILFHKVQKPGNHPKERIQHSQHGESLKSRKEFCHDSRRSFMVATPGGSLVVTSLTLRTISSLIHVLDSTAIRSTDLL